METFTNKEILVLAYYLGDQEALEDLILIEEAEENQENDKGDWLRDFLSPIDRN